MRRSIGLVALALAAGCLHADPLRLCTASFASLSPANASALAVRTYLELVGKLAPEFGAEKLKLLAAEPDPFALSPEWDKPALKKRLAELRDLVRNAGVEPTLLSAAIRDRLTARADQVGVAKVRVDRAVTGTTSKEVPDMALTHPPRLYPTTAGFVLSIGHKENGQPMVSIYYPDPHRIERWVPPSSTLAVTPDGKFLVHSKEGSLGVRPIHDGVISREPVQYSPPERTWRDLFAPFNILKPEMSLTYIKPFPDSRRVLWAMTDSTYDRHDFAIFDIATGENRAIPKPKFLKGRKIYKFGILDDKRIFFQLQKPAAKDGSVEEELVIAELTPKGKLVATAPAEKWKQGNRDSDHGAWNAADGRRAISGTQDGTPGLRLFHAGKQWSPFPDPEHRHILSVSFPQEEGYFLVQTATADFKQRFVQLLDAKGQVTHAEIPLKENEELTLSADGKLLFGTRPNGFRVLPFDALR